MYDHLADPHPPNDMTHVRHQVGRRVTRRRQLRQVSGAGVALCAIVAVAVGVGLTRNGGHVNVVVGGAPSRPVPAESTFLTVASISPSTRSNPYPGLELQDRSLATGRVLATLVKGASVQAISASIGPSGTVIAAITTGQCGAVLESINPHTGRAIRIGDVPDASGGIIGLSVSPDGRSIAYEAYPGCQQGIPTPTTLAPPHSTPTSAPITEDTYLAVRNLASGATVTTSFGFQGVVFDGNGGPAWSPDGTRLAVLSPRNRRIMLVSAIHPDLQTATTLSLPAECDALGDISAIGAWKHSGLTVSLTCTQGVGPGQRKGQAYLEQITATGHVTYRTPMSGCFAVGAVENIPGPSAIIESYDRQFGAGASLGGNCSGPSARIASYDHGRLRTVLTRTAANLPT